MSQRCPPQPPPPPPPPPLPQVLQPLLNLAEFMELADRPLPIDIRKLGVLAERCHAYAKALHYREIEFHSYPAETIEALISINNHLQQLEAAQASLCAPYPQFTAALCSDTQLYAALLSSPKLS